MSNAISLDLVTFLGGTFAAAFVTGLAGFAFGMVAAGILVARADADAVFNADRGLRPPGSNVCRLEAASFPESASPRALHTRQCDGNSRRIAVLRWMAPTHIRVGVGALLIIFSLYNLIRLKLPGFVKPPIKAPAQL